MSSTNPTERPTTLQSEVHQTVVDVLFSVASLKAAQDPFQQLLTSEHFSSRPPQASILKIIPVLYKDYVQELRKHRNAIFGSGSSQTQESTVQNRFRDATIKSFKDAFKILISSDIETTGASQNVSELVEVLEEANVVGYGVSDALSDVVFFATTTLERHGIDAKSSNAALSILASVCRMDFDTVVPFIPNILRDFLTVSPTY